MPAITVMLDLIASHPQDLINDGREAEAKHFSPRSQPRTLGKQESTPCMCYYSKLNR